jgi:hypothetical protein
MALFPCAVGSHRYTGPQRSAYLGIASGGLSARSKLRLCREHFQELSNYCHEYLLLIAIGDTSYEEVPADDSRCFRHTDQVAAGRGYATLYPQSEEAQVFFAALCDPCEAAFRRIGQIELA